MSKRIIHAEGYRIIGCTIAAWAMLIGVTGLLALYDGESLWRIVLWAVLGVGFLLLLFLCRFFRVPDRNGIATPMQDEVIAPADGTVVAIEEVTLDEVLVGEKRLQVSIFMSVWNVHINWFPVGGTVEYVRHHPGKFLVAWHPKSSTDNERTTTVVKTQTGHRILFRQIAGFVARRIVNYAVPEGMAVRGAECGFIKFGSRVDLFLPLGSNVHVRLNDKVTGTVTRIATLPTQTQTVC